MVYLLWIYNHEDPQIKSRNQSTWACVQLIVKKKIMLRHILDTSEVD